MFHRSTPSTATGETPSKLFMGREMQTRMDVMKPRSKFEIVKKPSVPYGNKDRQSIVRNLEIGDMVQMRNYSNRNKWVRGRIENKISNKMYEVRSGGKLYVRHIDHIIRIDQTFNDDADQDDDDWHINIETENCNGSNGHRYPQRIRRPVVRYGIDD